MTGCAECSRLPGYRRPVPGKKGWRSPVPDWWVAEGRERLGRRGLDKKTFALGLRGDGHPISEMMVLRALHRNPAKRIVTIETLNIISDELKMPRPVVVAQSFADALELQRTVSFNAADAERLRISAEVDREKALRSRETPVGDGSDGGTARNPGEVDDGGPRAVGSGPSKTRRAPRAR